MIWFYLFYYSNLRRETGGLELISTKTLIKAIWLTKCASHSIIVVKETISLFLLTSYGDLDIVFGQVILSILKLHLCFFNGCYSIKVINRSRKEINTLLSEGMSNIYFKVSIEKKWLTPNVDILSLKVRPQASFWGAPTHANISDF